MEFRSHFLRNGREKLLQSHSSWSRAGVSWTSWFLALSTLLIRTSVECSAIPAPPPVRLEGPVPVHVSQSIRLTCPRPPHSVHVQQPDWMVNNSRIQDAFADSEERLSVVHNGWTILIRSAKKIDGGRYQCHVNYTDNTGQVRLAKAERNVRVLADGEYAGVQEQLGARITHASAPEIVHAGQTVKMVCVPWNALVVYWKKNEWEHLRNKPRYSIDTHNGWLVITNISKADEGNFTCRAENGLGGESEHFRLVVLDQADSKPPATANIKGPPMIRQTASASLTCEVKNSQPGMRIEWDFRPRGASGFKISTLDDGTLQVVNQNAALESVLEVVCDVYAAGSEIAVSRSTHSTHRLFSAPPSPPVPETVRFDENAMTLFVGLPSSAAIRQKIKGIFVQFYVQSEVWSYSKNISSGNSQQIPLYLIDRKHSGLIKTLLGTTVDVNVSYLDSAGPGLMNNIEITLPQGPVLPSNFTISASGEDQAVTIQWPMFRQTTIEVLRPTKYVLKYRAKQANGRHSYSIADGTHLHDDEQSTRSVTLTSLTRGTTYEFKLVIHTASKLRFHIKRDFKFVLSGASRTYNGNAIRVTFRLHGYIECSRGLGTEEINSLNQQLLSRLSALCNCNVRQYLPENGLHVTSIDDGSCTSKPNARLLHKLDMDTSATFPSSCDMFAKFHDRLGRSSSVVTDRGTFYIQNVCALESGGTHGRRACLVPRTVSRQSWRLIEYDRSDDTSRICPSLRIH